MPGEAGFMNQFQVSRNSSGENVGGAGFRVQDCQRLGRILNLEEGTL